jgi:chemotaxis regulatin CheY-phosphate phosphatase CheZ
MFYLNLLLAAISCSSAFVVVWYTFRVLTHVHSWNDRVETVEDRIRSLQGKISREDKLDRDTIRDQVDSYIATLDFEKQGSGMGEEIMQMMLAQSMQGMTGQQLEDASNGEPEQQELNLFGQGGK